MKFIDLAHPFSARMPTYPGDPKPALRQIARIGKEGYADHWLQTGMHVGTHIDAPAHMILGGKEMHELPPDVFCGRGVVVDVRGEERVDIGYKDIRYRKIQKEDIVLFCTGWSKRFGSKKYFTGFPIMTEALAKELVKRKVKMVGFDAPSPDRAPFIVHKILLRAGILIAENLTNLEKVGKAPFEVWAFPLKIEAGGAPARVVAVR